MSLYNTLNNYKGRAIKTIRTGIILTSMFALAACASVGYTPKATATQNPTATATSASTLEQMVEPTATIEPTVTATPTPVEYGEGITRIEMLAAINVNPSVINLRNYNVDSRTQFRRILRKNEVLHLCVVPYLVEDEKVGRVIGAPGVLDELDVLRVDIDESLIPSSYGNHIQVVYDIGHMENDKCVSGIKGNPVMELSVALAYQNGNFQNSLLDGIEAINWPEKNTIAPVHEVDLDHQWTPYTDYPDWLWQDARSSGYADLAFIVFEELTPNELVLISNRLEEMFPINPDIYERILLTDADGDGLFNLLPNIRYDLALPRVETMFTDERGIISSNTLQDPEFKVQDRRLSDARGFIRTCDVFANIVTLYSTHEQGLTTFYHFNRDIMSLNKPADPVEQRAPIGSGKAQEYLLLVCGPKPDIH